MRGVVWPNLTSASKGQIDSAPEPNFAGTGVPVNSPM